MSDTQASEAARTLVSYRWGNRVVEQAAETVISRYGELHEATRAALLAALDGQNGDDAQ